MLIYKGKAAEELTREELIECALCFRDAHVQTVQYNEKILRRMQKMELALTKEQIEMLDWWLSMYPMDSTRGNGEALWPEWIIFKKTPHGYRAKGDKH
jgi:hypothetical protein